MVALGETIAVIDKSGKVVSSSKHIFGVFKEARSAYRSRKAEIHTENRAKQAEREARQAIANLELSDGRSSASRRHPTRSKSVVRHSTHASHYHDEPRRSYEHDSRSVASSRHSKPANTAMTRRHTSGDLTFAKPPHLKSSSRTHSEPHIDMNLAYGEFHPASLEKLNRAPDKELDGLVGKVKSLLIEADCAHHSASATMAHLQKNPDAMAAIALTLAEISTLAKKLAPTALIALRNSAPAVFALLSSPQFMIAAGVGLGVTIVMFGGYKIVKQITAANQANAAANSQADMDQMLEINTNLSAIESWRRGVADSEAESCGTSVDGEFITPTAAAMSGLHLPRRVTELREPTVVHDAASSYSRHSRSSRSSRRSTSSRHDSESSRKKHKEKKPTSQLKLLFKRL
ncbi:hypothetical protein LOY97_003491 [Ophidiomyces ophidiicola]|nr:hypothetical protein LOZ49_000482 [Ophidiomyces ophidiicola]KAI2141766.1 hypothetical protein LOZ29_001637 [Ophidiomyces ophidiicola]KAI2143947.1 hypothetical protein LOZ28_001575 [Ophidiomyces ophidiicola]KAI2218693.1 hypothetical protein LOZ15_003046 [Ophidiomyces ophidiicola]KAI2354867.1 hypothetical protein LOY92_001289 [Ophidiomyces ophidiicola]